MKFNENKFEQMAHGPLKGLTVKRLGTSSRRNISRDAINRRNHAESGVMCRDVISRERDPKKI